MKMPAWVTDERYWMWLPVVRSLVKRKRLATAMCLSAAYSQGGEEVSKAWERDTEKIARAMGVKKA